MKLTSCIILLIAVVALSAVSIVVERAGQPNIAVSTSDIVDISFTDSAVGVEVGSIDFFNTEQYMTSNASMTLNLAILDIYGNTVDNNQNVDFYFAMSPPTGANLNGQVTEPLVPVTVTPDNGIASITLNSGEGGVAVVSASMTDFHGSALERSHVITIYNSAVTTAGIVNLMGVGTNYGSGQWRSTASAICSCDQGFASPDGLPCTFSIVDQSIDWANIEGNTETGAENYHGFAATGCAYTNLVYHGSHSLETLLLQFSILDVTVQGEIVLPLNGSQISMVIDPTNPAWTYGMDASEPVIANVIIYVQDGQGCDVSHAEFRLASTRGTFIEAEEQYQVEGAENNRIKSVDGVAIGRLQFIWAECPPVVPPPNEVNVTVSAILEYDQSTTCATLNLLNYN